MSAQRYRSVPTSIFQRVMLEEACTVDPDAPFLLGPLKRILVAQQHRLPGERQRDTRKDKGERTGSTGFVL